MSLLELSTEILDIILSKQSQLSGGDFYNISLTCKRLNLIARPSLHDCIRVISPTKGWTEHHPLEKVWPLDHLIEHFDSSPKSQSWVRQVYVFWDRRNNQAASKAFDLASKFSNMQKMHLTAIGGWDEDLPFLGFIGHCKHFQYLQHLEVWNVCMSYEQVLQLHLIPNLEYLNLAHFEIPKDSEVTSHHEGQLTRIKKLELQRTNSLPMGSFVEILFKSMPSLQSLIWTVQAGPYTISFDPRDVSRTFSPVKACLVDLHLTLVDSWGFTNHHQMDFSDFTALKSLEIHERLMLARNFSLARYQHSREDLPSRLPHSLQRLEIIFVPKSYVLRTAASAEIDYGWIIYLAEQKSSSLTQLKKLTLIERTFWPVLHMGKTEADFPAAVEWDYPPEVERAYAKSKIKLRVILRASEE